MAKLCEWIEDFAEGEKIEAVVIGEADDYGTENIPRYDEMPKGVVISWSEAKPFLEYDFDKGFGSIGCNAVVAWTKSWVISVSTYDGSTSPFRVPRNPMDHAPDMPGGG